MRALLVAVALLGPALAAAAPPREVRAKQRAAQEQLLAGEPEAALALVDQGLALAPRSRELLLLRGHVLLKLVDYGGALAAYRAYLAAGASGGNRREVLRIVSSLESASTTFLRVVVANGPADVRVDARSGRPFCVANPECRRGILPGDHLVIVERPGHQRVARRLEPPAAQTTTLELEPGEHSVEISAPGRMPFRRRLALPAGQQTTVRVAELRPRRHTKAWIAAAVGGAGLAAGTVFGIRALGEMRDYDGRATTTPARPAATPRSAASRATASATRSSPTCPSPSASRRSRPACTGFAPRGRG